MQDKVRLILDTDIGCDCDDAGAMAVMHALARCGEVDILAVTHCYGGMDGVSCIDAINRYCGQPDIPVGNYPSDPWPDRYAAAVAREFPNQFQVGGQPEHTVRVLRRALKDSSGQVTLAVIGSLRSIEGLMDSMPDDISSMTGIDMIRAYVSHCVIMGGRFHQTWPEPLLVDGAIIDGEFNIRADIPAAQHVANAWPGELVFCSYEIGLGLITGAQIENEDSPIRLAYQLFGAKNGRDSWDLATVLFAVRPDVGYYNLHEYGRVEIDQNGITKWIADDVARHTYLLSRAPREDIRAVLDGLMNEAPMP